MTTTTTKLSQIHRSWYFLDLNGQTLGRASTQIAAWLIGKHRPYYTPNLDCGDYVVAINASQVKVTGQKPTTKLYRHHTGFPGGFRELTYSQVAAKDPREIIIKAVTGMLPKNKLRSRRLKRLKVFVSTEHPYTAQLNQESYGSTN
ncbi:50S ribosomal protein L13 [Microgenomates group bacterium RBG_16_45_19]|nr:MAG: 50S ribosomal protein L13 [Microgenomates group bacterium RBG_16_45_19]